jgi:hypothetical protein
VTVFRIEYFKPVPILQRSSVLIRSGMSVLGINTLNDILIFGQGNLAYTKNMNSRILRHTDSQHDTKSGVFSVIKFN